MPATNLFRSYKATSITPTYPSGAAITLDEITDIDIDGKSTQIMFHGDGRAFPRIVVNAQKTRSLTIKGANIAKMLTIPEDAECTITTTLCDARNGVGSGALVITATRATMDGKSWRGPENNFATGDFKFTCAGSIGVGVLDDVDPITIVQTP